MAQPRMIDWDHLTNDLVLNCRDYHQKFYEGERFSGPGLHFHQRALNAGPEEKTEMVYAVLATWGTHRMGRGPQINGFDIFKKSLSENLPHIESLYSKTISSISETEFNLLAPVFEDLNVMKTPGKLITFSKIMAHYLPLIVSPIDNEYTYEFLFGRNRKPGTYGEFEVFRDFHLKLVKGVAGHKNFIRAATPWLNDPAFQWDTSFPKIVDNLIIGKIFFDKLFAD